MTEQEAIEKLKFLPTPMFYSDIDEAKRMGIKALEEIQQLRNEMLELNQLCRDYTSLGTVEELKEAKEKQIAKKPYYVQYDTNPRLGNWHCPNCDVITNDDVRYCKWCGTRLDWGNEDDRD